MSTPQFDNASDNVFDNAFEGLSDESLCPGEDRQSDFRCLLCHFWDSPEVRAISASSITLTNGGASSKAANDRANGKESGRKLCQRAHLRAELNPGLNPRLNPRLSAEHAEPNAGPDRASKELSMLDFLSTDRDLQTGDRPNRDPESRSANRSPESSNLLNMSDVLDARGCDRPQNRRNQTARN